MRAEAKKITSSLVLMGASLAVGNYCYDRASSLVDDYTTLDTQAQGIERSVDLLEDRVDESDLFDETLRKAETLISNPYLRARFEASDGMYAEFSGESAESVSGYIRADLAVDRSLGMPRIFDDAEVELIKTETLDDLFNIQNHPDQLNNVLGEHRDELAEIAIEAQNELRPQSNILNSLTSKKNETEKDIDRYGVGLFSAYAGIIFGGLRAIYWSAPAIRTRKRYFE